MRSNQLSYRPLGISLLLIKQFVWTLTPQNNYILFKEVIQPQVPLRLPCYDFTPVAEPTVVGCLLKG